MEEMNVSEELEQMRSEYAVLKRKLNEQEVINNKLIISSVRGKINYLTSHERMEYVFCLLAIALSPVYHTSFSASWAFCAATVLFMLFCGYWTWKRHRELKSGNVESENMLTVVKKVRVLRQEYIDWLKIAIPLLVAWLGWLFAEIFMHLDRQVAIFMALGVMSGLIIGGFIGLRMRRNVIRTCDEIISQIED